MTRDQFDDKVTDIINELPEEFRDIMCMIVACISGSYLHDSTGLTLMLCKIQSISEKLKSSIILYDSAYSAFPFDMLSRA